MSRLRRRVPLLALVLGGGLAGAPAAADGTIRILKQTAPANGTGFSFSDDVPGSGGFSLNDGGVQTLSSVAPGVYTISENDPSISPGNFTLADVSCDDADSSTDLATRSATVSVADGEVVTCVFRNLGHAPTDTIFVFHLDGSQVVGPLATAERGGCFAGFDAGASRLTLVCTHDVVVATSISIQRGAAGADTSNIAFDLGSPASPVIATWSGMSPADVANLLAGNFYVEIASSCRPTGAIRGQILPRTVDTVAFGADGSQVVPPNASTATANCGADLDTPATNLALSCTHDLASPDAAHLHLAPAGSVGPVVFTFASPASPLAANAPLDPRLVADFAAGFLYLDLHASGGSEEIRGQILAAAPAPATGILRIANGTQPPGGAGFVFNDDVACAAHSFTLADGGVQTFTGVVAGTYTVVEDDPAITPGGWQLTELSCDDADSDGVVATRTATVRLQAGETVTCTFRHLSAPQAAAEIPTLGSGGAILLALGLLAAAWLRLR